MTLYTNSKPSVEEQETHLYIDSRETWFADTTIRKDMTKFKAVRNRPALTDEQRRAAAERMAACRRMKDTEVRKVV